MIWIGLDWMSQTKIMPHFFFVVVILTKFLIFSQNDNEDCPFTHGSCPVTLDNVVDVYFHDIGQAHDMF